MLCPRCGTTMKVRAVIDRILRHLRVAGIPDPFDNARPPPELDGKAGYAMIDWQSLPAGATPEA